MSNREQSTGKEKENSRMSLEQEEIVTDQEVVENLDETRGGRMW